MVEKITVSPQEVRGYGNVVDEKELEDYGSYRCDVSESSEVINGVEERIFCVSGVPAPSLSIANVTEDTRRGRCAHISASFEDGEGNGLDDKPISLKSGDNVLATITTESGENVFDVILYDSAQLYAVFDGDDYYPPAVSEAITVNPAKSFWDVEFILDEEEYELGDTAILSGTVGTVVDEIVDEEVVTRRQMEAGVTLALVTDLGLRRCTTNANGEFALQVPNIQQNQWRAVIASDSNHLIFNGLIDVPVHDYSILISESESSTPSSRVLLVGLTDFNSEVEGATVSIAGSDGSSYTAVTDSMGEATVSVGRLTDNTTFTATYENASSSCTVIVDRAFDISYQLDSNTPITVFTDFENKTFTASPAIEDGALVMNYGRGYNIGILSQGWSNAGDWVLECDFMQNRWDSHLSVFLGMREHYNDYEPYSRLQLSSVSDRWCGISGWSNGSGSSVKLASPTYSANTWTHLVIEKRNGKYVTLKLDGTTVLNNVEWADLLNYDTCYIGGASWWNSNGSSNPSGVKIKNIRVRSIPLFVDECSSADNLSSYGTVKSLYGSCTTGTIAYNSTENAYKLDRTGSSNNGEWTIFYPITAMAGKDNFTIEADVKSAHVAYNRVGFGCVDDDGEFMFVSLGHDYWSSALRLAVGDHNAISYQDEDSESFSATWYHMKVDVNGGNFSSKLYDLNGNELASVDGTASLDLSTREVGIILGCPSNSTAYVRNIEITRN